MFLLVILLTGGLLSFLVRYSSVQNYLVQKATSIISERTNAVVKIGSFGWNLFEDISLNDFYLGKKNGDTLIAVSTLYVDLNSWSLLNKKVEVDAINLKNGKVNLTINEDGTLDLAKLFASANQPTVDTTKPSLPFKWYTSLKKFTTSGIVFNLKNNKDKSTVFTSIEELTLTLNKIDIGKKKIELNHLEINNPIVRFVQYDTTAKKTDTIPFTFLPKDWYISWNSIDINKGSFSLDKTFKPAVEKRIDFNHLLTSDIHLSTDKGFVNSDSVSTKILALRINEKCGIKIVESKGDLLASLREVHYTDFLLKTENSELKDQLALRYNSFSDFKEFIEKVNLQANLHESKFSLKDLSYFVKGIEPYAHNTISIDGKLKGKISGLDAKDIVLKTGNNTTLSGSLYTSGLPRLQETFLNIRLKSLHTSVADIRRIAPNAKIPDNLNKLQNINFSGDLDGFLTDFVARGNLNTNLGNANSDLNFKYDLKTSESAYSGNLNLQKFKLGEWFNDTAIGDVSLTAKINGKGLKIETLNSKIEGRLDEFTYKNYSYKNLTVNGSVKGKSFQGALSINDPNLDVTFNGKADMSAAIPTFKFNSNVKNISLKELHITTEDYRFQGTVDADFTGKNIDDLDGSLTINDLKLARNDDVQMLRSTTLKSTVIGNGKKSLVFETDMAEGRITGKYSLTLLPKILKSYFNKTIYKIEDTTRFPNQNFAFDFRIYDSLPVLKILDPKIKLVRNSFVRGEIATNPNNFVINASIPELIYDNYKIKTTNLEGAITDAKTSANLSIDKIFVKDSLYLDTVAVALKNSGDGYAINTQLKDFKNYNRLNTDLFVQPGYSSVDIQLKKTSIWLGGKEWITPVDNNVHLSKKDITISNLFFESGEQRITFESYKTQDTIACVNVKLNETSLNGFMAIFNTKVKDIDAKVNGNLKIERLFSKPIFLADLNANTIQLGKVALGNLSIKSSLNEKQNRIDIEGLLNGAANKLNINGYYSLEKNNQRLDVVATIQNGELDFLNYPFFAKYVKDVKGTFSGLAHLAGPIKGLTLDGNIHINDADVRVSYLNTKYKLHNEDIALNKDGYFDIGELVLTDERNNTAKGYGRIYHDNLKKFRLDLNVNTQNAMFMNTTAKDNSVFYGQIFANGRVTFKGTIPVVDIHATAKVNPETHCYIPINSSFETNKYSFYKFVNKQSDSLRLLGKKDQIKPSGVNFTVEVDVTPDATLDILLDPAAGDILSSKGSGNLKIEVLRTGEFNIYGLYEIDRGNYLFTLQNIINKRFQLNRGGTINFRGDIYKAQLNADASYDVRTSTYDLIYDPSQSESNLSEEATARAKNRITTKLLLKLTGVLEKPDVAFDISPQDPDPLIRTLVENKMQLVRSVESEMNKQVFGLLVMNRFLPASTTATNSIANPNYISGGVANTVSEFLTSQLSMYVSNFFENINVKDFDVNLNFRQYDQQSNTGSTALDVYDTRRELQLALTKRFFNNRLSINVGGNLDFGDRYTDQSGTVKNNKTTNVNGDFQVEYALTKSGNFRAKAFNRGDYDNFNQRNRNKTGLGLSFRQDFDNFKDLFKRKNPKKKPESEPKATGKNEETPIVEPTN